MGEVLKHWEYTCSLGDVMRRDRRLIHLFVQQTFIKPELLSQCALAVEHQTRKPIS